MSSATNFRSPLQETTLTNKENDSCAKQESYRKFESHVSDTDRFQSQTIQDVATFLNLEQDKFPNLKRLNVMLLEKLKETNSKLRSLELEKEEWEKLVQNSFQEKNEELAVKLRETEERETLAKEELEQVQLQVEIHLKELEKAREDFDNISSLFEEQLEENSTLQEEKSDILKQVRLLKDAKKQLEMSVEQLRDQLHSLSNENERLKQKIQQYQMAFEVRDEALQQISAELREKRERLNQLQIDYAEKEDKILKLEQSRKDFEIKNSKLEQAVKENQQFLCEFHSFVSELENGHNIPKMQHTLVSSREQSVETLSVDSFSETNETAEWQDLGKLKKIVQVRSELFLTMQQQVSELETKLMQLSDTVKSQKQESKKTVMMSRLFTAIRRLFSFWLLPTKRNSTTMSLQYENTTEKTDSPCCTYS